MRSLLSLSGLSLALALVLLSCATKPQAKPTETPAQPADAAPSSVQAEATGLAPAGEARFKTINFAILFGNREGVKAWSLTIREKAAVVRTLSGDGSRLPDRLSWDGKNDAGTLAPEGLYSARLAIDYGGGFNPAVAESKPFLLDLSPPTGGFSPNPAPFILGADGQPKPTSITIMVKPGIAKAFRWTLDVYDPSGSQVKGLSGPIPAGQVSWDGRTDSGGLVAAGRSYPAVLTVFDEYGNSSVSKGSFVAGDIPSAEPSSITTRRLGFSPTSSSVKNTIDLFLSVGSKASVRTWTVKVMSAAKGAIRSFTGGEADLPDFIRWDGRDDGGALAAEGSYYATLALDYGKAYRPALVQSRKLSVVMTPPTGSVTVDPPTIALADLGPGKPVTFTVQAKSAYAQIAGWTLDLSDSGGRKLASFRANWPNNKAVWDGRTADAGPLAPGTVYKVSARVEDEYGNSGALEGSLSVEGLPAATEPTSIEALSLGFAPEGDHSADSMRFALYPGNLEAVANWRVNIASGLGIVAKTFGDVGNDLPKQIIWDGKTDSGSKAPEGDYKAEFYLDYGVHYAPVKATSESFTLDLTPPSAAIQLSPGLLSPDGDGENDSVTIALAGSSRVARIVGWSATILDPGDNPFMTWKGNWPAAPIVWNGRGSGGDLVESASDYEVVLRLRDEFGNIGETRATISTDILVLASGDGYRIRVPSIVFKGYTADYRDIPPEQAAKNLSTLDLLAAKLAKFPEYRTKLEGHAVMINWDNKALGEAEQRVVLIPLSQARAEAIKAALVERGIQAGNLVTEGVGAKDPLVPDSDFANRWKNRRVEFYLIRP
jgi:flagellar hook assembly protein FlgD